MVKINREKILNFLIVIIIFFFDRITKWMMINLNDLYGEKKYSLTSFINLELIWNNGIAFGLLSFDKNIYYNSLTLIIIIITLVIFFMMINSFGIQGLGVAAGSHARAVHRRKRADDSGNRCRWVVIVSP